MMRPSLGVLALSLALACAPPRDQRQAQAQSSPQPTPVLACPTHGLDEDVDCPYVFTPPASGEIQRALESAGGEKACHLDGVQVAFTRAVVSWTAPGGRHVSLTLSAACKAREGAGEPPLVVSDGEEARQLCAANYAAVLDAVREGRLPKPKRRSDQPLRLPPPRAP